MDVVLLLLLMAAVIVTARAPARRQVTELQPAIAGVLLLRLLTLAPAPLMGQSLTYQTLTGGTRQCFYAFAGNQFIRTVEGFEVCPVSIEVGMSVPSFPAAPKGHLLTGQTLTGATRQCFYAFAGKQYIMTVGGGQVCPMSTEVGMPVPTPPPTNRWAPARSEPPVTTGIPLPPFPRPTVIIPDAPSSGFSEAFARAYQAARREKELNDRSEEYNKLQAAELSLEQQKFDLEVAQYKNEQTRREQQGLLIKQLIAAGALSGTKESQPLRVLLQQLLDSGTATSQRVGSQTYTTTMPQAVTYTTQRIGNFIYTRGSNGCLNTTQIIGTQTYTSGNCPK